MKVTANPAATTNIKRIGRYWLSSNGMMRQRKISSPRLLTLLENHCTSSDRRPEMIECQAALCSIKINFDAFIDHQKIDVLSCRLSSRDSNLRQVELSALSDH